MLSGVQKALCHPISTRCCFFIEAICCEARSSGTMHEQHFWRLWAMSHHNSGRDGLDNFSCQLLSTAVNCCQLLQYVLLQTHKYYTVTSTTRYYMQQQNTRHLGSSCASTCQATKTQSSLFDGHQSAWCASYENVPMCAKKNLAEIECLRRRLTFFL